MIQCLEQVEIVVPLLLQGHCNKATQTGMSQMESAITHSVTIDPYQGKEDSSNRSKTWRTQLLVQVEAVLLPSLTHCLSLWQGQAELLEAHNVEIIEEESCPLVR